MSHTVLVTGAFGKVGCCTLRHLLAAGHRVIAVDLETPHTAATAAHFGETVKTVWANICDPAIWPNLLSGVDAVIHLAAIFPPLSDHKPDLAIAVNQDATRELIKQMEASPSAKRLIFASSMVVAGHEQFRRTPPLRVDEEPHPTDLYGRTKVEGEKYIRASSLQWSILRLTVVCSATLSSRGAGNFEVMFEGNANGRIEVIHEDDAGLAFANAVTCNAAIGKTLFIGGGERCRAKVLDFYNGMLTSIGLPPLQASLLRPGEPYFAGDWVDTTASQQLLAFQRHSLQDIYKEQKDNAGFKRWILKLLSPLLSVVIARKSPYRNQ